MTGKSTRNYHQQILEYIKEEGYTVLPNTVLTSLVESNAEQFNKLYSLQGNICRRSDISLFFFTQDIYFSKSHAENVTVDLLPYGKRKNFNKGI